MYSYQCVSCRLAVYMPQPPNIILSCPRCGNILQLALSLMQQASQQLLFSAPPVEHYPGCLSGACNCRSPMSIPLPSALSQRPGCVRCSQSPCQCTTVPNPEKEGKSHTCRICHITYSTNYNLTKHMRTHKEKKSCVCEICEKTLAHASGLRAHMRIHTNDYPFMCEDCPRSFNSLHSLQKHTISRHPKVSYPAGIGPAPPAPPSMSVASGVGLMPAVAKPMPANLSIKQEPNVYNYPNTAPITWALNRAPTRFLPLHKQSPCSIKYTNKDIDIKVVKRKLEQWLIFDVDVNQPTNVKFTHQYQQDIEAMQVRKCIPHNDPRESLRGQYGIFAKSYIPPGTLIGIYAGQYYNQDTDEEIEYTLEQQRYLFALEGCWEQDDKDYYITIDGLEHGNYTACVNANTTHQSRSNHTKANVYATTIHYLRLPLIGYFSMGIKANSELLIDYGKDYWATAKNNQRSIGRLRKLGKNAKKPILIS